MRVSVIVCTYLRDEAIRNLLASLAAQAYRDFEVLVVDGSGDDPAVRREVGRFLESDGGQTQLRLIRSPKGLTRQRNVGLAECRGDVVCFLDDDVTVGPDFLGRVTDLLRRGDLADVGGLSGYDVLNYPTSIGWKWRLRYWLRAAPSLRPGDADRLGFHVPVSFLRSDSGHVEVKWLPGYCQVYRRTAIDGIRFDEQLPTYGGEDRDFSMQVGRRWRLLICPDLAVPHHYDPGGRVDRTARVWQTSFGIGRAFAKSRRGPGDYLAIARYMAVEFVIDVLAALKGPSRHSLAAVVSRQRGIVAGLRSGASPGRGHAREGGSPT